MSQSGDSSTSGKTDCSEAMEAKILDGVRKLYRDMRAINSNRGKSFVRVEGGSVRVLIEVLADDAGNRAVQKTHPENQNGKRYCECGNQLEDYEERFCVACGL